MKKIIFLIMILLPTVKSVSQTVQNAEFTKEYYLQKSKSQKTAAWILVGAGTALTVVGAIGFNSTYDDWSDNSTNTYGYLMLAGPLIGLGSIPLFITSGHNARKAATLSLNYQPVLVPDQGALVQNAQPSLSLKIIF
jgi:hypothetical protein